MKLSAKDRLMTPRGCVTLLPESAEKKRTIESTILGVMRRWGFNEIVTPIFEYLDVLSAGMGEDLIERGYKLTDRSTGRLMMLRPDITPQVARIAGSALKDLRPLRLSYCLNVFRYEEQHGGRQREIYQIGAELIGLKEPEADAEIIAIASEALSSMGIKDFRIAVSQRDFLRGFLEKGYDRELKHEIQKAFERKESSYIELLFSENRISEKERGLFIKLIDLFGEEDKIAEASSLVDNEISERAIKNLTDVYSFLKTYGVAENIIFDFGEARGFDYHTGVFFEIFLPEFGYEIGSGGRYDNLVGNFGEPSPATGFALDLGRIMESLETGKVGRIPETASILIVDFCEDKTHALQLARELRVRGYNVTRDIIKRGLEDSVDYASKLSIPNIIVIEEDKVSKKVVTLINSKNRKGEIIPLKLKKITERLENA